MSTKKETNELNIETMSMNTDVPTAQADATLEVEVFDLRGTKIKVADSTARSSVASLQTTVTGLQSTVNGKVDKTTYNQKVGDLESDITTNANNITNLQNSLTGKQDAITGGISTGVKDNFSPNRVMVTNSDGKLSPTGSSVSSTELSYLSGLNNNVQDAFDYILENKQDKITYTENTKTITIP